MSCHLLSLFFSDGCPLSPRWVKINFDASVSLDNLGIGIGCCVRDYNGTIIFAASRFKPVSYSILFAELEAIAFGLLEGVDLGFSHIVTESDAKTAIDLILSEKECFNEAGLFLIEIATLSSGLDVMFSFMP